MTPQEALTRVIERGPLSARQGALGPMVRLCFSLRVYIMKGGLQL